MVAGVVEASGGQAQEIPHADAHLWVSDVEVAVFPTRCEEESAGLRARLGKDKRPGGLVG